MNMNKLNDNTDASIITEKTIKPELTLQEEFTKRLRKWALISTVHGLSNIARAESIRWRRYFWSFCLLVCLVLCALLVADNIGEYFKYDVVTKSRTLPLDESELFPVVSICNQNPFISAEGDRYLKEFLFKNYVLDASTYLQAVARLGLDNTTLAFERALYSMNLPGQSFLFPVDEFFFDMKFNGFQVNFDDLEPFFDPKYGPCFRFNSGKNATGHERRREKIDSQNVNLEMTVLVGVSYDLKEYLYEPSRKGILIEVKDPDGYPFMSTPVSIEPGVFSQIQISQTHSQVLPTPYSECVDMLNDKTLFDDNKKSAQVLLALNELNISYSNAFCAEMLAQDDVIQAYDCYDPRLLIAFTNNSTKACEDHLILSEDLAESYSSEEIFQSCPLACEKIDYKLDITKQEFPTNAFYQESLFRRPSYFQKIFNVNSSQDVTMKAFGESLTHVSMVFRDLTVTQMSEKPKIDTATLFSNLGGIIGIFLGFSVLTLAELIELLVYFLAIIVKKLFRRGV